MEEDQLFLLTQDYPGENRRTSDSLVGEILRFEDKGCLVFPNLLCYSVCKVV